jgi:hypothetical protein
MILSNLCKCNRLWCSQVFIRFGCHKSINDGVLPNKPTRYSSGVGASSSLVLGADATDLRAASYLYTGMGAAESNVDFAADGSFIYSPAITSEGIGYATSRDSSET